MNKRSRGACLETYSFVGNKTHRKYNQFTQQTQHILTRKKMKKTTTTLKSVTEKNKYEETHNRQKDT